MILMFKISVFIGSNIRVTTYKVLSLVILKKGTCYLVKDRIL